MNLIRLLAVLLTALALTARAQIQSLPIGSVDAVVKDTVARIDHFTIEVNKVSTADEIILEYLYYKKFSYTVPVETRTPKLLEQAVREKLVDAVNKVFSSPDPSWAGQEFQTAYAGWLPWNYSPGNLATQLMFATDNIFTLVTNPQGKLVPPEAAYKVDLTAAVMRSSVLAFVVLGIERAALEVWDKTGNVIVAQDSRDSWPGSGMIAVQDNCPDILFLPRDYATSGQPGRVLVWYKNGAYQSFRLNDGSLIETVYPEVRLTIAVVQIDGAARKAGGPSNAIKLSLSGIAGQTVELQATENLLSPSWTPLTSLTLGTSEPQGVYVDADAFAGGRAQRFYRAVAK